MRVQFTQNLRRHVECPTDDVPGTTVREALDAYFARHPEVRSYVLDDQGAVRRHMAVFAAGEQIRDPVRQSDPLADGSEIHVMQALSGG